MTIMMAAALIACGHHAYEYLCGRWTLDADSVSIKIAKSAYPAISATATLKLLIFSQRLGVR